MYKNNNYIDLAVILYSLNLHNLKEHSSYFTACCPSIHHNDKNPSWIIYKNTGVHKCFSCGFQGGIDHLVKYLTNKSLLDFLNIEEQSSYIFQKSLQHALTTTFPEIIRDNIKIEGKFLPIRDNPVAFDYMHDRGAGVDFIKQFDIKYAKNIYINETFYNERICIPIIRGGKLINVEGRDITGRQKPKVLYCRNGISDTLFNIDNLDFEKPLFMVEGVMDIIKIYEHISKNVTCTFGVSLSANQIKLIPKIKQLILIPDNDDGGKKFISAIDNIYTDREFEIVTLSVGEDPNSISVEDLKEAINKKQLTIDYWLDNTDLFLPQPITWED